MEESTHTASGSQNGIKPLLRNSYHALLRKYTLFQLRRKPDALNFLFIIGYMRSGSSLLVNLLVSNPQIIGFGETHRHYEHADHLLDLVEEHIQKLGASPRPADYFMDKLLHNNTLVDPTLLLKHNLKVILLLREPEACLRSTIKLFEKDGHSYEAACQEAENYFLQRMPELTRWVQLLKGKKDFITVRYEDLVESPEKPLGHISNYLQLTEPLQTEYKVQWFTGMKGVSDSSDNIRSGRILKKREADKNPREIPKPMLEKCTAAHSELLSHIQ